MFLLHNAVLCCEAARHFGHVAQQAFPEVGSPLLGLCPLRETVFSLRQDVVEGSCTIEEQASAVLICREC